MRHISVLWEVVLYVFFLLTLLHTLNGFMQRSKIAIFGYVYTLLGLTPPTKWFHWDDLRKIFIQRSWMAKVPHGIETLPKISIYRAAWLQVVVWTITVLCCAL